MHVAKTNPILPPLRDTLFMEPPASSSLARLSGTSQARACSEVSSAGAESGRATERKMWILRADGCRLSRGWPQHLRHLKHCGCSHSSSRAQLPARDAVAHPAAVQGDVASGDGSVLVSPLCRGQGRGGAGSREGAHTEAL